MKYMNREDKIVLVLMIPATIFVLLANYMQERVLVFLIPLAFIQSMRVLLGNFSKARKKNRGFEKFFNFILIAVLPPIILWLLGLFLNGLTPF